MRRSYKTTSTINNEEKRVKGPDWRLERSPGTKWRWSQRRRRGLSTVQMSTCRKVEVASWLLSDLCWWCKRSVVAVEQIQKSAETFLLPIYREAGPNSSVKQHSRPKPLTDANTSKATDMVEFFFTVWPSQSLGPGQNKEQFNSWWGEDGGTFQMSWSHVGLTTQTKNYLSGVQKCLGLNFSFSFLIWSTFLKIDSLSNRFLRIKQAKQSFCRRGSRQGKLILITLFAFNYNMIGIVIF